MVISCIFFTEFKVDDFNVELCRSIVAVYDVRLLKYIIFDECKLSKYRIQFVVIYLYNRPTLPICAYIGKYINYDNFVEI